MVKIINGNSASLAAAWNGLVGTTAFRNSLNGGGAAAGSTAPMACRKASAASGSIGKRTNSVGVTTAAMMVTSTRIDIIVTTERMAVRPALAAFAVCTMPVISKATTKGITVIRRPLSQIVPTTSAMSWKSGE